MTIFGLWTCFLLLWMKPIVPSPPTPPNLISCTLTQPLPVSDFFFSAFEMLGTAGKTVGSAQTFCFLMSLCRNLMEKVTHKVCVTFVRLGVCPLSWPSSCLCLHVHLRPLVMCCLNSSPCVVSGESSVLTGGCLRVTHSFHHAADWQEAQLNLMWIVMSNQTEPNWNSHNTLMWGHMMSRHSGPVLKGACRWDSHSFLFSSLLFLHTFYGM